MSPCRLCGGDICSSDNTSGIAEGMAGGTCWQTRYGLGWGRVSRKGMKQQNAVTNCEGRNSGIQEISCWSLERWPGDTKDSSPCVPEPAGLLGKHRVHCEAVKAAGRQASTSALHHTLSNLPIELTETPCPPQVVLGREFIESHNHFGWK